MAVPEGFPFVARPTMTIRQLTKLLFGALAFLAIVCAVSVLFAVARRRDLVALEQARFASYQLSDELRSSSDELTWFVRSYVVTGDPKFERGYRYVLDVRDGRAPRPKNYSRMRWELAEGAGPVTETVAPISLRQLMLTAGFTADELALLDRAHERSDTLVALEETALHAMQGRFRDATGAFSLRGPPDQARAIRLTFDSAYIRQKVRIMAPIDSFSAMVEQRTQSELDEFLRQSRVVLILLESIFGLFVLLSLLAYPVMRARVLSPVAALQEKSRALAADIGRLTTVTTEIARGDLTRVYEVNTPPPVTLRKDEIGDLVRLHDSMLGQLSETGGAISSMTVDLRNALNALDAAYQNLQVILDSSPVAVAVASHDVLRYCNTRFVEFYGDAVGSKPGDYYADPEDREAILAALATAGTVRDRVVKYRTRDGRVIDAITSIYSLTFQREPAVLAWIVDVTHLKEVEAALHQSIEQLRALEQMRDELVQMLVHDMRSPLSALLGELQLMELDATGDLAERAKGAMVSVWRVNEMASTLLDLSRLETGQMPLSKTPTDLTTLAEQARAALAAMEADRTIEVVATGPVRANCDAGLIRRVIENLLSNAIKHTPGGGKIRIVVSAAEGRARVAVQDEGLGVPPEARARIFQKFGGVAVRKDRQYHSVGLGLAFCRLAIEAHGGTIGVSDAPVRGSEFAFELPE